MRQGMQEGFVLPRIVIDGVLPTVQAQVYDNPIRMVWQNRFLI